MLPMGSCCGCSKANDNVVNNEKNGRPTPAGNDDGSQWIPSAPNRMPLTLRNASSPSLVATNELTLIYDLPSKFRTENEIIKAHGYELGAQVAKGGFANVYKAKRISDGTVVACKVLDLTEDTNQKVKIDTRNELFVLERTSHPNIIKLFEHFMIRTCDKVCVYIWMTFASGDSLSRYMREISDPLPEQTAKNMFAQVVAGVRHMHQKGIAHRDLKMGNILLDSKRNVMISDFGLSRVSYRVSKGGTIMSHSYCGTVPYMAPEVLGNRTGKRQYNPFIADIWSMGIILYCMTNKAYPFDESNGFDAMIANQTKSLWKFSRFVKSKPSLQLYHVLKRLLEPNCNKRITIAQLADHCWIRDEIKTIPV